MGGEGAGLEGLWRLLPLALVLLVLGQTAAFMGGFQALNHSVKTEDAGFGPNFGEVQPQVDKAEVLLMLGLVCAALAGAGWLYLARRQVVTPKLALGIGGAGLVLGAPLVGTFELDPLITLSTVVWIVAYFVPVGCLAIIAGTVCAGRRYDGNSEIPTETLTTAGLWALPAAGLIVLGGVLQPLFVASAFLAFPAGVASHWRFSRDSADWPRILTLPILFWWAVHVTAIVGLLLRMDGLVASV